MKKREIHRESKTAKGIYLDSLTKLGLWKLRTREWCSILLPSRWLNVILVLVATHHPRDTHPSFAVSLMIHEPFETAKIANAKLLVYSVDVTFQLYAIGYGYILCIY